MKYTQVILIILIANCLGAQEFDVQVSTDTILLGNHMKVTFVLDNLDGKFLAPEFGDADIISGPNSSSSISIVNGSKSSKKTYSYYLKPSTTGILLIPPASVMTDNDLKETEPMEVIVLENPEGLITNPDEKSEGQWKGFGNFNFDLPLWKKSDSPKKIEPEEKNNKRKLKKI